ncbi:polysaccharide deacetylase family protein [Acuticoccus mangrovi]|uniref:Chitooligosaccharide deacetylase n=1 Tax=Acuticoccus mangrovi TaxID=2796142 RepID=A0A934IKX4_9HYPH|nr:polysaccharide deacetylase family protein [Acuticoccus mangrovi]MBJ3778534.1 polysaccharide deacetylase family protein [Acuticoccus mangrovi]
MTPSDYGPFPFVPITERPRIVWPGGAGLAVWVITNIEFFPLTRALAGHPGYPKGNPPSVRPWAQRDYGNRVGVWRIMDALDEFGVPGTATVNADIWRHHPQILTAARERGWEFMGHNETNSVWLDTVPEDEQRAIIARCAATLEEAGGVRPTGWLGAGLAESWHTLDQLIDEGFTYVADWVNDDQPYLMDVGGRQIVSIPYSYEVNDSPVIQYRAQSIDEFELLIRRQFDVLHREGQEHGRVMAICLHPYIIGVPHRIDGLRRALDYIASHDGVWLANGRQIVEHYLSTLPR